jgi:hypothetical protein
MTLFLCVRPVPNALENTSSTLLKRRRGDAGGRFRAAKGLIGQRGNCRPSRRRSASCKSAPATPRFGMPPFAAMTLTDAR